LKLLGKIAALARDCSKQQDRLQHTNGDQSWQGKQMTTLWVNWPLWVNQLG